VLADPTNEALLVLCQLGDSEVQPVEVDEQEHEIAAPPSLTELEAVPSVNAVADSIIDQVAEEVLLAPTTTPTAPVIAQPPVSKDVGRAEEQAAFEAARTAFDAMTRARQQEMIISCLPQAFDNNIDAQEKFAEFAYNTIDQALFAKVPLDFVELLIQKYSPEAIYRYDEDDWVEIIDNNPCGSLVNKLGNVLKKLKSEWFTEEDDDEAEAEDDDEAEAEDDDEAEAEDDDKTDNDDHHAVPSAAGTRPSPSSVAFDMEAEAGGIK